MHIYVGVGVSLLHFQKPATWKNCNTNVLNNINKVFQICFLIKDKLFYIKKWKLKKYLLLLFEFFSFFVFLSLSLFPFLRLLLCQTIFVRLASFLRSFFVFKESNLQYLTLSPGVVGGRSPLPCTHVGRVCKNQTCFEVNWMNFLNMLVLTLYSP